MTSRSVPAIEHALLHKGFTRQDSHHRLQLLLDDQGRQIVRTRLSHGITEYGDDLLAQVARQLRLTKRELLDLIDCRTSGDEYLLLLRERMDI